MKPPSITDYSFSTVWPDPRKRWSGDVHKIGVYAIIYDSYCYVGMTVSVNGFKARWSKHHRNMFVKKRKVATPGFKKILKDLKLDKDDFKLYALKSWDFPSDGLSKSLVTEIAKVEQSEYDRLKTLGFTMLNAKRPTGSGYVTEHVKPAMEAVVTSTKDEVGEVVLVEIAGADARGVAWKTTVRVL